MFGDKRLRFVLFLLFVIVPIIEIAVFIQVGEVIGVGFTLLGILATAIIGAFIVRQQGFAVFEQAREKLAQQKSPVEQVIHGVFILLAGLLLLTPGFFTDAIGFAFLVPPLRLAIARKIMGLFSGVFVFSASQSRYSEEPPRSPNGDPNVIDGVAVEIDPKNGSQKN